jgi:hypothetical protein
MERGVTMSEEERIVAVISPWGNLPALVKRGFRVESLPREKKVMVWREDLDNEKDLVAAVKEAGIGSVEVRTKKVVAEWEE